MLWSPQNEVRANKTKRTWRPEKKNRRLDAKSIYQYVWKHFASNLNENDIANYIASMLDKNIIVNSPTLKGDLDFIVADIKTQKGGEVSNDDQHELFH